MQTKQYKIQPEQMSRLPVSSLEFFLDFDDMAFIWGYSEKLFAQVCETQPQLARLFAEKLSEMAADIDVRYDSEFMRPGSGGLYDDKSWLTKLAGIASKVGAPGFAPVAPVQDYTRALAAHSEGFVPPPPAQVIGTTEPVEAALNPKKLPPLFLPAPELGQAMLPLIVARSGLFGAGGARNAGRKAWSSSSPRIISHFSGIQKGQTTITYTGEELWTGELELWGNLLNESVTTELGQNVTVRFIDALHAMPGRGDSDNSRERVRTEGNRLKTCALKIRTTDPRIIAMMKQCLPENKSLQEADKKKFVEISFSLFDSFATSSDSITYRISRDIRVFFGNNLHTWYDLETYYSLPTRGLSRRLYVLYCSHYNCYPLTATELTEYLGVKSKTTRNVKGYLKEAHDELKARGIILDFEFRVPTAAERPGCTSEAFVATRPNRESKVVQLPVEEAA